MADAEERARRREERRRRRKEQEERKDEVTEKGDCGKHLKVYRQMVYLK